jgi:hypothetical protein
MKIYRYTRNNIIYVMRVNLGSVLDEILRITLVGKGLALAHHSGVAVAQPPAPCISRHYYSIVVAQPLGAPRLSLVGVAHPVSAPRLLSIRDAGFFGAPRLRCATPTLLVRHGYFSVYFKFIQIIQI